MKCLILFSGKNKKNITTLSSAELAKRVVKVKEYLMIQLTLIISKSKGLSEIIEDICPYQNCRIQEKNKSTTFHK